MGEGRKPPKVVVDFALYGKYANLRIISLSRLIELASKFFAVVKVNKASGSHLYPVLMLFKSCLRNLEPCPTTPELLTKVQVRRGWDEGCVRKGGR